MRSPGLKAELQTPTVNQQVHKDNLARLGELETEMLAERDLKGKQ